MKLNELCAGIGLFEPVKEQVIRFADKVGFENFRDEIEGLKDEKRGAEAAKRLETMFSAESAGVLACLLQCAAEIYAEYRKRNIPAEIYLRTMKCFTRFLGESFEMRGKYIFDRAWWAWRQLSMRLFRIGELEYEFLQTEGTRAVWIHIPSDADFKRESCGESVRRAKGFVREFFPQYEGCPFCCESWLLSPVLRQMLPENSNIIRFQNQFRIESCNPDDHSYRFFVFRRADGDVASYPEKTSLQRKLKSFLLAGGKLGAACGYLI